MTVKELIEKLSKLDKEAIVLVRDYKGDGEAIKLSEIIEQAEWFNESPDQSSYIFYSEDDPDAPGKIEAKKVVLLSKFD